MKKLLILAGIFSCTAAGFADAESHQAAAEQLVSVVSPKEVYVENFQTIFESQVEQFRQMRISEENIGKIMKASEVFAEKVGSDPELTARMVQIYQEAYTEDEIRELMAFYETPIGKKSLQMMPQITQQKAIISQQTAMKYQVEFQEQIQTILSSAALKTAPDTTE